MLGLGKSADNKNVLDAISKSQAVIEFDLKGNILTANRNFVRRSVTSFRKSSASITASSAIRNWPRLMNIRNSGLRSRGGEFQANDYRRITKTGSVIWIEASYNPVFRSGKPYKVVKIATDITAKKIKAVEDAGKLEALSRSQATIEFCPTAPSSRQIRTSPTRSITI